MVSKNKIHNLLKKAGMTKSESMTAGFTTGYAVTEENGEVLLRHRLSTMTSNGMSEIEQRNAIKAALRSYIPVLKQAGLQPEVRTDASGILLVLK